MFSLEPFKIDLKGLDEGLTTIKFDLNNEYFEAIDAPEINKGQVGVVLSISRVSDFYELNFIINGVVTVQCDRCLKDMELSINIDSKLVAKFGEEYSEEDDLVTVPENEGILDVAWFIYEFIDLNIPIKHVHAPGKCDPAMMKMLDKHSTTRSSDVDNGKDIDPRWSKLEKLKTIIKD